MNTGTRILAVVLALLILAGGYALSSFAAPIYDEAEEPLGTPATPAPALIPVENPEPEATPAPEPVEEPSAPAPESPLPEDPDEKPFEEPAEEPAEEPEQEPEQKPEGTPEPLLEPEFFDDAAFLGDSISGVLEYYGLNNTGLGKPTFLVTVDYSVQAAVDGSMLVHYRGRDYKPEGALAAAGVSKVYIMLGAMGDLGNYGIDKTMENWAKLIENIREKNPEIRIFIQSCTPLAADTLRLTNQMIDEYNARLKDFAAENDCTYVEIGEHFKDAKGLLSFENCRDGFAHLRIDSAKLWVELLKDPANYSVSPRA